MKIELKPLIQVLAESSDVRSTLTGTNIKYKDSLKTYFINNDMKRYFGKTIDVRPSDNNNRYEYTIINGSWNFSKRWIRHRVNKFTNKDFLL